MVTSIGVDNDGVRALGPGLQVRRGGLWQPIPSGIETFDLANMTIPKYRGHGQQNLPENASGPANVPATIQDGDMMIFYAMATAGDHGGPSDGTWTALVDRWASARIAIWSKVWHTGDSMTVPCNTMNGTGIYGIIAYSNVVGIHATFADDQSGNDSFINLPAAWAAVGIGSRALVFQANDNNGDWPLHVGADGWRTDADTRRWNNGGIILSTTDPAVWSAPRCTIHNPWSYSRMCGIMLLGPTDYGDNWDDIPTTIRPVFIDGTGYAFNANATLPLGANAMQEGDFWLIGTGCGSVGDSRIGAGGDAGPQGIWCLGSGEQSFLTYLHGRFITAAEVAANAATVRHLTSDGQSHGGVLLRGVNPHCPLRRVIEKKAWTADIVYNDFVTGVNTMPVACVGSNAHSQYGHNWDHFTAHVRWNPQGGIFCQDVADGELVSGLHIHENEGQGIANVLMELRGS